MPYEPLTFGNQLALAVGEHGATFTFDIPDPSGTDAGPEDAGDPERPRHPEPLLNVLGVPARGIGALRRCLEAEPTS
ncbi:hypothetical protein AB0G85_29890 [Streptomyces sioyaensis]|uniref:hypothetical protein n=1 Tax=Streptomyces sioyaensis TaxID=67364 RepID=UPI0034045A1C